MFMLMFRFFTASRDDSSLQGWKTMLGVALGTCVLHTLHTVTLNTFKSGIGTSSIPEWKILLVAEEMVATVNALMAVAVGWYTVNRTGHDIINARAPLIYDWTWLVLLYFVYDIWAMYRVHAAKLEYRGSLLERVRDFVRVKRLLIVHHVAITLLGGPVALHLRGSRGDFVIGCFFLLELSTPFVALRATLAAFDKKTTLLYKVNGVMMVVAFFICRILIFPFMYVACARTYEVSVIQVLAKIPWYCHTGNVLMLALQLHWFALMARGAVRVLRSGDARQDIKEE
ncbi:TLC domain-containing protein 3A-like isoform X1 [Amphibalanus amphitrite]|uniref:TLC domain-containing protein 3A-like isoform X1 n=1 Tax=Amphibalanus amphitrite TaxID=1232801 RepID=UPI001C902E16|nr:TLC domain-containing protein 3A-like isoform X1 [Amphibalanus amphitrite]XP_043213431.1 TLC domain-containing protein 3A-like isoform X1 [Amphibalanus amphitrite]XP_043213432.1 TLC domain-containing protein 3A-like isoform X1 [Amphibalanus amphitrite]XP_043213434.1 TLC domain-containing protein 3A-like isoform X1 [Amphibalanus amphitrite]